MSYILVALAAFAFGLLCGKDPEDVKAAGERLIDAIKRRKKDDGSGKPPPA